MVDLLKYSIILKQDSGAYSSGGSAAGICKLERKNGELHLDFKVQNLKSGTSYNAAISCDGELYRLGELTVGAKRTFTGSFTCPGTGEMTSAAVCVYVDYPVNKIVMSGRVGNRDAGAFSDLFEKEKQFPVKEKKTAEPQRELHEKEKIKEEEALINPVSVWTKPAENYDKLDEVFALNPRMEAMEKRVGDSVWVNCGEYITGLMYNSDGRIEYVLCGVEPEKAMSANALQNCTALIINETDTGQGDEYVGDEGTYFEKNRDEIMSIFANGKGVNELDEMIPGSKWVWVEEDGGAAYIMGIISDEDQNPIYICYGVEGEHTSEPPQGMEGYCRWLPRDMTEPRGKGYWMMYQDAMTGHTVRPQDE